MIENLLHTDIVLSQKERKYIESDLRLLVTESPNNKIGVITFLGSTQLKNGKCNVHLLLRFDNGDVTSTAIPYESVIKKTFGDFILMHGNCSTDGMFFTEESRLLVTVKLDRTLKNPIGFMRAKARSFVINLVSYCEWIANERDKEDEESYFYPDMF